MNKKNGRFALWYYIITMILFMLFPKWIKEHFYVLVIYIIICVVTIYFLTKKSTKNKEEKI